ncbi:hypothetical protein ACHAPA_005889, partial [Fusarium lateritium]
RCVRLGFECIYSVKGPMGRPTKRKLGLPSTPAWPSFNVPDDVTSTTRSVTQLSSSSPSLVLQGLGQLEVDVAAEIQDPVHLDLGEVVGSSTAAIESSSDLENIPIPALSTSPTSRMPSAPAASLTTQSVPACACLASFYLTMDHLCKNEKLTFPSGLQLLRQAIATATEMAHCQICPGNYLFAMQNINLLGALVMAIVKQYDVILQSIDEEGGSLNQQCQSKRLHVRDPNDKATDGSTTDGCLDYPIELTPAQWITLAKKAVKNEVYGKSGNQDSLWALLVFLEQRQIKWHAVPPRRDCRHNHEKVDEPFCIKIIWKSKEMLEALNLQEANEEARGEPRS